MGQVKAWVMDIQEEIYDAIGDNEIITEAVIAEIALKCNATPGIVQDVYEDIKKEYYGEW
jgi:hypothetical protein